MTASDSSRIPSELQALRRWCRWHIATPPGGKPTKVPDRSVKIDPLSTFDEVVAAGPINAKQGIGFVFTGGVLIRGKHGIALDIDGCRNPATTEISDWAFEILARYASFAEITPSGTGLRLWLLVRDLPRGLRRTVVNVAADAPPGVDKQPQIQIFGGGTAQYVTVTGDHLRGTPGQMIEVQDLSWLIRRFGFGETDAVTVTPVGEGTPPSLDEVEAAVRRTHGGLADGHWEGRGGSPSEAYFTLVRHVLEASRGHGEVAIACLLERTAWGRGEIKGSKDASRYARESWVRNEVARVAVKAARPPAADVFEALPGEAAAQPAGLIYRDLGEFFEGEDFDEFCVHGVIPRTGLVQFFGDPASGKTPFALSLAVHVACPKLTTWFEHSVDLHGPVVYMIGEGATGLRKRVRAELEVHGLNPEDVQLHPTRRPGRLTDASELAVWEAAIRATAPDCRMLVVDTQSANFGPANENSTEDMQRFCDLLMELARRLQIVIVLVHHTGHANKDRARGSIVLLAALDGVFSVTREGSVVTAEPVKAKDWEMPEPLVGRLLVKEVRKDRKGRPVTAVALRPSAPTPGEVFADMEDAFADDMLEPLLDAVAATGGEQVTVRSLADGLGATEKEVRLRLARLEELALIVAEGPAGSRRGRCYVLTDRGENVRARRGRGGNENEQKSAEGNELRQKSAKGEEEIDLFTEIMK